MAHGRTAQPHNLFFARKRAQEYEEKIREADENCCSCLFGKTIVRFFYGVSESKLNQMKTHIKKLESREGNSSSAPLLKKSKRR